MVFQCLWSVFCLTFTTGTPHRVDIKSNTFFFLLLSHWWQICYQDFDVCKLFIAFQHLCFCWNDMLDWGFILVFFCTCCCKNFSCYLYILSTGKNYWLKEKRMSVSLILFFSTQDLRWIKMYAKLFAACLCWELCIICAPTCHSGADTFKVAILCSFST